MLDTLERPDTRIAVDVDWDKTPQCESEHLYSPGQCTARAEYVVVYGCNRQSTLWCRARYREFMRTAEERRCRDCKKTLIDCWRVRPL